MRRSLRRFVRWTAILAAGLAVLLGIVVLAVQAVLWQGEIPRRLVEDALQEETGLHVRIGAVRTGWFGKSLLDDVEVWTPLDDEPIARIPRARIQHTDLLAIIARRPVDLDQIELESPVVLIREDVAGTWNVDRALDLIDRAQQASAAVGPQKPADLPMMRVRDGTIRVVRADGSAAQTPFTFSADPDRIRGWSFTFTAPGRATASGRIAPSGMWLHEIEFQVTDVAEFAALWDAEAPQPIRAAGRWRGETRDGGVAGTAWLTEVVVGAERARGTVAMSASEGRIRLESLGVTLESERMANAPAQITTGAVTFHQGDLRVDGLIATFAGAHVTLDGAWDNRRRVAEARAKWSGGLEQWSIRQEGWLHAEASLPRAGLQGVRIETGTTGRTPVAGEWDGAFTISAWGTTWEQIDATIAAQRLRWSDREGVIDLSGARFALATSWPVLRLVDVEIPRAEVHAAAAQYNLDTGDWAARLDFQNWDIPRLGAGPVRFAAAAAGTPSHAIIEDIQLIAGGVAFQGLARYEPASETPVSAQFTATTPPQISATESVGEADRLLPEWAGQWAVEGSITGSLEPLLLSATGRAAGQGLQAPGAALQPITFAWRAGVDDERAWLDTEPFHLVGGSWRGGAVYATADRVASATLRVQDAPLDRIAEILGAPVDLAGVLTAEVEIAAPRLDLDRLAIQGEWSVDQLAGTELGALGGWGVDRGRGRIATRARRVELEDILLELQEGQMSGKIGFNLDDMQRLDVSLQSRAWPVAVEKAGLVAAVNARAELTVDLVESSASGRFRTTMPIFIHGQPYAQVAAEGQILGRTLVADLVGVDVAGGRVEGLGTVPLDDWRSSRVDLRWHSVDLATALSPVMDPAGLSGTVTGRLSAAPAEDARALEPFRIELAIAPEEGVGAGWRSIELGPTSLTVWIGPDRWLLDQMEMEVAGGQLELWSRVRQHNGERFAHVQASFNRLNLVDLIQAVDHEAAPSAGVVSGRVTFGGYLGDDHRAFGSGTLRVEEADLAVMPVISHVYGLLNLRLGAVAPTGVGQVEVRLEDRALVIRELRYFNRGTDIIATGQIQDIWQGAESPITGVAVGRVRPLRDLGLPFMRDLDDILTAVQTGGASVRIGGTLGERDIRPAPFEEVGAFLRGVFGAR